MTRITTLLLFCFALSSLAIADEQATAQQKFEKLKSLAGQWHGKDPKGGDITVTYEVVANGSVVMERIQGDDPGMITMYHMNGDNLMMTHYCAAMNQPRMQSVVTDHDNVLAFKMIDITNLASDDAGHMAGLAITLKDPDHISHAWTFIEAGKEMTTPFELTREKVSQK